MCGKDFTPLRLGARAQYCKQRCRDVARGVVRATPLPERVCEHKPCGASFVPVSELQRRCSERCTRALHKRLAAKRAGWTDQRRDADHRRRALKAGAATGEPVRRAAIAERDAWVCHLCSEPVRPELAHPDPWSASLDHVVPLSRGGAHDPANVRLAHLRCNVRKGAALLEEVPA